MCPVLQKDWVPQLIFIQEMQNNLWRAVEKDQELIPEDTQDFILQAYKIKISSALL